VGVGGSGKQCLARLAAFISGCEVFQVTLTRSYDEAAFRDDLRKLYQMLGAENKKVGGRAGGQPGPAGRQPAGACTLQAERPNWPRRQAGGRCRQLVGRLAPFAAAKPAAPPPPRPAQVMFLFTDAHVADEGFLELVNNMLTSGMVPALYSDSGGWRTREGGCLAGGGGGGGVGVWRPLPAAAGVLGGGSI
jgi:hypothetical protein